MATFDSIEDYLDSINRRINEFDNAVELAANSTGVRMLERIFDQGRDIDGNSFEYAGSTRRIRQSVGRQTSFVDFRFTGRLQSEIRSADSRPIFERDNDGALLMSVTSSDNIDKLRGFRENFNGRFSRVFQASEEAVSYTHLTLPTICSV